MGFSECILSVHLSTVTPWMQTHCNCFCVLQMGFFRRHYREIIEAEKNRNDSDESWDWVQKSQWELGLGSENPISCYLHHGSLLKPSSLPYVEEKNILQIFRRFDTFFHWWRSSWRSRWPCGLPEKTRSGIPLIPMGQASCQWVWRDGKRDFLKRNVDIVSILADDFNPQGAVEKQKSIFYKMYSILYRRELQELFLKHWWLTHAKELKLFLHSVLMHRPWRWIGSLHHLKFSFTENTKCPSFGQLSSY